MYLPKIAPKKLPKASNKPKSATATPISLNKSSLYAAVLSATPAKNPAKINNVMFCVLIILRAAAIGFFSSYEFLSGDE
jgi:hypothetical protein